MSKKLYLVVGIGLLAGFVGGSAGAYVVTTGGYTKFADSVYYLFLNKHLSEGTISQGIVMKKDDTPGIISEEKAKKLSDEDLTQEVVGATSPSVVSIIILKVVTQQVAPQSPFGDLFPDFPFPGFNFDIPPQQTPPKSSKQEIGGGTGFVVSSDGMILTNKHVAAETDAEYMVVMNDGKRYPAKVLARDPSLDLAILKIDAKNLKVLPLGNSDKVHIGQTVIAIGNALGEFRNTVTKGVISGIGRKVVAGDSQGASEVIEGALQTDAAINPGNSGGPLLDLEGRVIGINTAVSSQGQLIGFAIPINEAKQVILSVETQGRIVRPFLGVRYVNLTKENMASYNASVEYGALVIHGSAPKDVALVANSPADKAGIKEGDIILEVNGTKLDQDHSLAQVVLRYKVGEEVSLKILRQGKNIMLKLKLEERK